MFTAVYDQDLRRPLSAVALLALLRGRLMPCLASETAPAPAPVPAHARAQDLDQAQAQAQAVPLYPLNVYLTILCKHGSP